MQRPIVQLARCATAIAVVGTVLLVGSTASWAHVTPQPPSVRKGASDVILGFAVPNETTTNTATVKFELDVPTSQPITGILAEAKPGWTSEVETTQLAEPINTDDGQVDSVVSKVTWTATGPGIEPNEYSLFTILAGSLPSHVSSLTFKALQTYSDGTVVSWIEPVVKGTPAPEHPAPVIMLTGNAKKS